MLLIVMLCLAHKIQDRLAAMSATSSHPTALRVAYLATLFSSVVGSAFVVVAVARRTRGKVLPLVRTPKISMTFMVAAALLIVLIPFLPLLPTNSLQLFHRLEEAIKNERAYLAAWSLVTLVGYSCLLFFLGITAMNSIRKVSK
jgi:Na+/phosphate symporter